MARRLTQEEFVQKVNDKYKGKYEVVGEYVDAQTPIEIKHRSCGTIFPRKPNKITAKGRNCKCPICYGYKFGTPQIGINDLWTTHPEFAKLLKNPEDGFRYSKGCNDKTNFICPHCNGVVNKPVYEVVSRGYLPCPFCSSGKSYPNRFMANLLRNLDIDFIPEYKISSHSYQFDFYFIINSQEYIVEMDGALGHGVKKWGGEKDVEGLERDLIKNKICLDNNIQIIRIDCNYDNNRFEYIKDSILNSDLNLLFDFTSIDFNFIDKLSTTSLIIDIANYWNSGVDSYDELIRLTGLSHDTIRRYMKSACDNNYIKETYEDVCKKIRLASNKKISNSKSQPVMCDQTKEFFASIKDAKLKTGATSINGYLQGKFSYAGKLSDGTKLTWTKLTNEQYEYMLSQKN